MVAVQLLDKAVSLREQGQSAYRNFRPRRDQPERYDQQTSFYNSKNPGVAWLIGGNGAGTTECALAKVAKFLLREQPPPRKDTPFWVISGTYEQVMETCWKEKLYGHGHVPGSEIEWDRIAWYRPNDSWPFRVPLKPWPGRPGKNWVLEFKSYDQGRANLQARSIGGFMFSEQFPWSLLEEVLRGCREYAFLGNKLCEFTPIDPYLSAPIEDLIERDALPKGWQVYRANTECAMEAGHVTEQWFEEFFGMVPEEMLLTRLTGHFASYEGCIYQSFNPLVHLYSTATAEPRPDGGIFRRAIDWGFGVENAFVCLFGHCNGAGEWDIYDEYYSTDQSRTVQDHLAEISKMQPWPAANPLYGTTWCDPSDVGSMRLAQREGWNLSAARNSVREGIDYVRSLLQVCVGTERPRLRINRDRCPHLARQMRTYRWVRGADSRHNPRDARPEPLKKDDHAVDALRYLVFSESQAGDRIPTIAPRDADAANRHGVRFSPRGGNGYSRGLHLPADHIPGRT